MGDSDDDYDAMGKRRGQNRNKFRKERDDYHGNASDSMNDMHDGGSMRRNKGGNDNMMGNGGGGGAGGRTGPFSRHSTWKHMPQPSRGPPTGEERMHPSAQHQEFVVGRKWPAVTLCRGDTVMLCDTLSRMQPYI